MNGDIINIYNQFPLNNEPVYVFSVGNQRGEWLATLPEGAEDYFAQWLGGGRGAQFHHRGRFKLPHFRRGWGFGRFHCPHKKMLLSLSKRLKRSFK